MQKISINGALLEPARYKYAISEAGKSRGF
jgi:hypothetical protein